MPYLSPELTGERLLVGANFASAGIGILNDTGIQFVRLIFSLKKTSLFICCLKVFFLLLKTVSFFYFINCLQLNIIRIYKQLEYFQQYQQRVTTLIGAAQTERLVNQALVLITLGGNDFVNNYYLVPFSARSRQFSLPDYVRYLISEYRKVLRVSIVSLSPLLGFNRVGHIKPMHMFKVVTILHILLHCPSRPHS